MPARTCEPGCRKKEKGLELPNMGLYLNRSKDQLISGFLRA